MKYFKLFSYLSITPVPIIWALGAIGYKQFFGDTLIWKILLWTIGTFFGFICLLQKNDKTAAKFAKISLIFNISFPIFAVVIIFLFFYSPH
jgi:hypothetical protein